MKIAALFNDRMAIPALQQLAQNRLLQAVATSDRSPEMIAIAKQMSAQAGIPVQIFTRKNFETDLLAWLHQHKPETVLVKTFPFRIPAAALSIPKNGFINFHYAPLPDFRGSNPLFWMLREGVTTGGVTVHRMDEQFDTGPILLQQAVSFNPDATFGMCATQLAYAGMDLTLKLLQGLQAGNLKEIPQEQKEQRWYGRPAAADLFIRWNEQEAAQVKALVKACNPWLKGTPTRFRGWTVGIADASVSPLEFPADAQPGTILQLSPQEGLVVACKNTTALAVEVIYTEEGFFAGHKLASFGLKAGDKFE